MVLKSPNPNAILTLPRGTTTKPYLSTTPMELSRDNPRALAFPASNAKSTTMPNTDLAPKPPQTPILDRYRALLKQRDDDLRVSPEDDVSPPSTEEIVQLYEMVLSELLFNSKPIITDLTIIAGEQRDHGKGIADAICARILEVSVEHKLPSLYLLDSIVKNIGRDYVRYFSTRLPEVFCEAYRQVQPAQHSAMRHLFGTWSSVFPPAVLRRIEAQLQFSPQGNQQSSGLSPLRASESPRPAHGIHINPKYLHQLDNPNGDGVGSQRLGSRGTMSHSDFSLGSNRMQPSSSIRLGRSSSPSNIGLDELEEENSPRRFVERPSPSNSAYDYRAVRDEEPIERRRKHYIDGSQKRLNNGPRALIDAYGKDSGDRSLNDKPLHVGRHGLNGLDHNATSISWQNTEEEEFDWKNVGPSSTEHTRSNDYLPSSVLPSRSYRARVGLGTQNGSSLDSDVGSTWSSQAYVPSSEQLSVVAEDPIPPLSFSRGFPHRFQISDNQGTRHPREAWNLPFHPSQPSQSLLNAKEIGRNFQMPGISPGDEVVSTSLDARLHGPTSRMGPGPDFINADSRTVLPMSTGLRPPSNVHNSHPPPVHPIFPSQNQRSQYGFINSIDNVKNHGPYKSLYMPEQQLDGELGLAKPNVLAGQNAKLIPGNHRNQGGPFQPQFLPHQEPRDNYFSSPETSLPPYPVPPRGYSLSGQCVTGLANTASRQHFGLPTHYTPNAMHHLRGEALPPLPPGPPTMQGVFPVHKAGSAVSNNQQGSSFTGLISSLMAHGVISLTNQGGGQDSVGVEFNADLLKDSVGVEFNADLLKVRHESAITALYYDLPRQCTTCGLRFKCQEEHSSHMDLHVTKNRMSKNRKQKPSRKWFVTTSMWLSGAEALGTDAVPGFLPVDTIAEKKSDEEMAVPADEDQNSCALCGEPFEDFYSDETEEWMYKGAVYLNAPHGSIADMDRSQLGPIVHAKCRPKLTDASPGGGFGQDEGGTSEEGSRRKRLRS